MDNEDLVIADVQRKIDREKALIHGAQAMRNSTQNQAVQAQAENQIREIRRNIEYLESTMRQLQMRKNSHKMASMSVGSTSNGGQLPSSQSMSQPRVAYGNGPQPSPYGAQGQYSDDQVDYGDPGSGGSSQLGGGHGLMPARGPFQPSGPAASGMPKGKPNYTRLDLIKYDTPYLGPRIQLMLSQLEFKLSVEKQYKDGIEKIMGSYNIDGDRKIRAEAQGRRTESMNKIKILERSLKRYSDLHVDVETADAADDDSVNAPSMRKPLTGQLAIRIHAVMDVDHQPTSRLARGPETFVLMKVEDELKGRTRATRTDKWTDELHEINIDKGNEIELTVYDKIGNDAARPIGLLWIRIADIVEEMRRKKIETEFNNVGWVSADQTMNNHSRLDLHFSPPPGQNHTAGNNMNQASGGAGPPREMGPTVIDSWFSLEPVGRIQLTMSFAKQTRERRPFDGLNRKGAIRQRKEDVHELYGHKFVAQQFYNIMRCALCGELLKYATGMQCSDCKYMCHEKCYPLVVTKCISKSNAESDPDEAKLNHRIPHRFETYGNIGANWCCQCGYMLPLGRKNCRRCKECKLSCHAQCTHLVPDFCGMSMKDANRILGEIKTAQAKTTARTHTLGGRTLRDMAPRQRPATQTMTSYTPGSDQQEQSPTGTRWSYGNETPGAGAAQGRPSTATVGVTQQTPGLGGPAPSKPAVLRPAAASRTDSSQSSLAAAAAANALAGKTRTPPESSRQQYPSRSSSNVPSTFDRVTASTQPSLPPTYNPQAYADVDQPFSAPLPQIPQPQPSIVNLPSPSQTQPQPPAREQSLTTQSIPPPDVAHFIEHREATTPAQMRGTGRRIGLDHFNFLAVLGKGNFGKVMLAETKASKQLYAIKVLKKEFIIENDEVESTKSERDVFIIANKARHPFLLNLHACFQTETRVYFVMEYISGGDLMLHIQRGQFGTKRAQFYAAEVCLALKYFHENGVVYRDLKLDNILLTLDGHIKIGDYGLCKKDMYYGSTTSTFCGTPEFMAPEILLEKKYGRAVDWWAFGVLIYQMLLQQSPFRGEDEDEIYDAILADEPLYPIHMPRDSVSILQKLLTREPELRLGSGPTDAQEIMSHAFFKNINWEDVYARRVPAPFLPQIKSATDTSNFDSEFTSVTPVLTPVQSVLSQAMQEEFRGFSYSADFV